LLLPPKPIAVLLALIVPRSVMVPPAFSSTPFLPLIVP
jgi:hypothetical protein